MLELNFQDVSFEKCLKCNACTASCPVSSASLDFGGPKHLGPELERLMKNQGAIDDKRIELCTLCGTCDMSCPEDVHVSTLTAYMKAIHSQQSGTKFRDLVLSNAELVGKIASTFAPITNIAMGIKPVRKVMEVIMEIPEERMFPKYRFKNFNRLYKKYSVQGGKMRSSDRNTVYKSESGSCPSPTRRKRKVAYYVGCYGTYNAPEIGQSFLQVMEYNGIEVVKPAQKCCGVPMFSNGQMKQGLKNANYNITSLMEYTVKGYDIVATCTSCTLALKKEYPSFVKTAEAKELASHVYDANEYLRMLKESGELNTNFSAMDEKAVYYAPCHMKAQGIGNPAMDILELIPNYEIQDVAADCCGQCGTFGFKEEKYEVSMDIGGKMAEKIDEVSAEYTVTECGMCKNQLDQLTNRSVFHPIQILENAYKKERV